MPRRPREESPTGLYHVTSRGTGGLAVYTDDADRAGFLAFLDSVSQADDWVVHAYCLMGTHFHLVLHTELTSLSTGMQRLKSRYGHYLNERLDRFGHVFQGRFSSRPIRTERHAVAACAYVAVNPVAARLCGRADEWRWSSHQAHVGLVRRPPFLASLETLGVFDGAARPAVDVYRDIVAEKERELAEGRKGGVRPLGV